MFKSIKIKNFQSHKDTTIEFDKGINIIKGVSNHGKTAILRALNWVINNKPDGDSYRSWWGGDTEVTLTLEDGTEIIRRRTDKVNEYQIKETHYTALNRGVPEDIQALINMNDVNIQNQLESVFLLNKTSGEIAKTLNNTVDLGIIDNTISNITQEYNQVNASIKHGKEQIAYYVRELYKYKNLDAIDTLLTELEKEEGHLNRLNTFIEDVGQLTKSFTSLIAMERDITNEITQGKIIEQALTGLADVEQNIIKDKKSIHNTKNMIDTYNTLSLAKTEILNKNKIIINANKMLEGLIKKEEELKDSSSSCTKMKKTIKIYNDHTADYTKTDAELNELKEAFKSLMPEVCPLCNK